MYIVCVLEQLDWPFDPKSMTVGRILIEQIGVYQKYWRCPLLLRRMCPVSDSPRVWAGRLLHGGSSPLCKWYTKCPTTAKTRIVIGEGPRIRPVNGRKTRSVTKKMPYIINFTKLPPAAQQTK